MFNKVIKENFEVRVTLIIFFLYSIAFGLMIFNGGLFFDDWVHYNQSLVSRIDTFKESGVFLYWPAYLYDFLFDKSIFFARFLIFIFFLFSSFFLYFILRKIKVIDSGSRIFIVLFFTLFPLNYARIALCNFLYALCYFLFFMGFWILSIYLEKKLLILRILSLFILFFSFSTNSLLVFYIIPILYIFYYESVNSDSFKSFIKRIFVYTDFILIPVIFWIINKFFFKPYGMYANYNKITLQNILMFPKNFIISFKNCFLDVIYESFELFSFYPFIIIVFSIVIFIFLKNLYLNNNNNKKVDFCLLCLGIFAFFLGVLPYLFVGKIPDSFKTISRHQLLLPLGQSFILYYGLKSLFNLLRINNRIKVFIYSLLIVLFISINFFTYLDFEKDYFKQLSFIKNVKESEIIKNNTTFLFKDNTSDLNAQQRDIGFDEYNGIMKLVFKDETRLGMNEESFKMYENLLYTEDSYIYEYIKRPRYNFSEYQLKPPEYTVIIDYGGFNLSTKNTFLLIYNNLFNRKNFEDDVKDILLLSYIKL